MAFLKYATAQVVRPQVSGKAWSKVRKASVSKGDLPTSLIAQATEVLGEAFDPAKYLLTHCSIVASVDVESVPNVKLGSVTEDGQKIMRKYSDYRVTPETQKFFNHNWDGWSREVLLKSYKTFVGGHNFCFAPGTPVLMADGKYKAIEDVGIGDSVITHMGESKLVTHIFEREVNGDIQAISIDRYAKPLLATGNHPFRVDNSWMSARDVKAGTSIGGYLEGAPTRFVVAGNEAIAYSGKVYNIEVADAHSYVVGPGIAVHNCEHVQLEELSKGRIIDAVARDIGPSVYVDILVATDRKHTQLIEDILSGKMSTLSMGCFRPGTHVSLANGVRVPIEEIQVGDMVRTHTGKAQKVANKHQMRSTWNMRTIRAVGLPSAISSTNNHEYLVFRSSEDGTESKANPEWVRADEIHEGDYLCHPRAASANGTPEYDIYKVKSVLADEYSGWVYDLGVEEDHSYIVEGATVHNCFTDETCCTYCGHVAADETELCKHIRFMKGSTFYDDKGRKNVIGELCGHSSLDPHGGVKFIEASWVETPAFTGAVLRNVLEAEKVSPEVMKKAELVLASPPPQWVADKYQKAANVLKTLAKNAEWGDPEEGGGDEPAADPAAPAAPSGPDPFSDLEKDIQTMVLDKVRQKVRDKLNEDQAAKLTPENSTAKPNDNIVKQANRDMAYRAAVLAIARTASSDIEFMEKLAQYNMSVGIDVPAAIYRSTLKVGSKDNMVLLHHFVKSCRVAIGRMPKNSGTQTLMRLGKFLSKREVN